MKKHTVTTHPDVHTLAEDAKALLVATAEVAEDKVVEARKRLAAAIEKGKDTWGYVQDRAAEGVKATDEIIRDHPYQAIGIAFGIGTLLGFLISRRN